MMRRISTWKEDHGRWKESPEFGSRKTRGFTLLEILASIVILGLLTLLIFSGFHFASRMADRVKTMATLKALSQAWFLYAAENNNAFPLGLSWEVDRPIERPPALNTLRYRHWWRWYGGIASYLPTVALDENEQYYGASATPTWDTVYPGYWPPKTYKTLKKAGLTPARAPVGFHFNRHIGFYKCTSLSSISSPSHVPVLYPYYDASQPSNPMRLFFSSPDEDVADFMAGAVRPLDGGNHFSFADGHVEWVPAKQTAQDYLDTMEWSP